MFILGLNKENGKKLIIANKYESVICESFYLLRNQKINTELNHLFPFLEFLKDLESEGINLTLINNQELKSIKNIVLFFSQDISEKILKTITELKLKESFYSVISIVEHPKYQIKNFTTYLNLFDLKLCPFKIPHKQIKTINAYIYKSIPTIREKNGLALKNIEILDSNIICSNLYTFSSSNYEFRRHVINIMSSFRHFEFKWFGRGWKMNLKSFLTKKGLKYLRSSLCSWPKLNIHALRSYGGELIDKSILYSSKTSISIENHSWPKGYVTEKFIEPLIYDCLPIYNIENFDNKVLNYIKLDGSNNLVRKNMEEILRASFYYKEFSIRETKKEASIIKKRINEFTKVSQYNTNLFQGYREILDKIT